MNRSISSVEPLESRIVRSVTVQEGFETLIISGTPGNDTVKIESRMGTSDFFVYRITSGKKTLGDYSIDQFTNMSIDLGNGDDRLELAVASPDNVGFDAQATIIGAGGNDTLIAAERDDLISGGLGNDSIFAGRGADTVEGCAGNDSIYGQGGHDVLVGGSGNDLLDETTPFQTFPIFGVNTLSGGAGRDTLRGDASDASYCEGGAGNDSISTGVANDTILAGLGDDTVLAGDGVNSVYGQAGNDVISSGKNNDWIDAGPGADTVNTGGGRDAVLCADGEKDSIDVGAGIDTVTADGGLDVLANAENVH